jgi:hypothetical protein
MRCTAPTQLRAYREMPGKYYLNSKSLFTSAFSLLVALFAVISCTYTEKCNDNFKSECVGAFEIDTIRLTDFEKSIIRRNHWDSVKLISERNGCYHFRPSDYLLKQFEGGWKIRPNTVDGRCMIDVNQNDGVRNEGEPFLVTISANQLQSVIVYFRKIQNKPGNGK